MRTAVGRLNDVHGHRRVPAESGPGDGEPGVNLAMGE